MVNAAGSEDVRINGTCRNASNQLRLWNSAQLFRRFRVPDEKGVDVEAANSRIRAYESRSIGIVGDIYRDADSLLFRRVSKSPRSR
jgi:hypothetical protein